MTERFEPELFPRENGEAGGARRRNPTLSKSRYTGGLQCLKRLYFECHRSVLPDPTPPDLQARFDTGNRVGALARDRYPGGRLMAEDHLRHAQAVSGTKRAVQNDRIPAIYEAAFTHEKIRIRADILLRVKGEPATFDLIEVKSGTSARKEHTDDVAIQLHVLRGEGLRIRRAGLLHLNRDYVFKGGDYDLGRLFRLADLTEKAEARLAEVSRQLPVMWETLSATRPPDVETGLRCGTPYVCPFHGYCHRDGPEHPVEELYKAGAPLVNRLHRMGVREIGRIPDTFTGLSDLQSRQKSAIMTGEAVIDHAGIKRDLKALRLPIHFLDFETWMPALPPYVGTHPYEVIPFQWSNHVLQAGGKVRHHEFLSTKGDDPRAEFTERLLEVAGEAGTIVTYSGYEARCLRALARSFDDLAPALRALEERIIDLLPLVRARCYHPAFHGSFGLKSVLPSLVPGSGYEGLEIAEGTMASLGYLEMIDASTPPKRREALRAQLLAYCRRDTKAMLELFRKFAV